MRKRYQKDSLANMKNSGEIHEQLVTYDEEGGGEMDTNGYVWMHKCDFPLLSFIKCIKRKKRSEVVLSVGPHLCGLSRQPQ